MQDAQVTKSLLIEVFGSSHHSSTKKNPVKVGPPLTKISGSAHVEDEMVENKYFHTISEPSN